MTPKGVDVHSPALRECTVKLLYCLSKRYIFFLYVCVCAKHEKNIEFNTENTTKLHIIFKLKQQTPIILSAPIHWPLELSLGRRVFCNTDAYHYE